MKRERQIAILKARIKLSPTPMPLAKVHSLTTVGLTPHLIDVEVNIESRVLPKFEIVGLAGKAVEESKERVRSAIKSGEFEYPNRKIVVNLAPADIPKNSPALDLPIALGILLATEQVKDSDKTPFLKTVVLGELSLDGRIRGVTGTLPSAIFCSQHNMSLICPLENAPEAQALKDLNFYAFDNLGNLVRFLNQSETASTHPTLTQPNQTDKQLDEVDFAYIKGQESAKRALEIAAAGGHNILMSGPPGCGKSLLSKSLSTVLPPMTKEEQLEVSSIYSIMGLLDAVGLLQNRPIRAPHHSISKPGLIGGGSTITPGEISLAHRGVLYLDEFPEFPRNVLEALRQPLEDGIVTITRASGNITFPSRFMLVASQNPCPCGFYGTNIKECRCSVAHINKYRQRVSGPLIDRIDIFIELEPVDVKKLISYDKDEQTEKSVDVRERVAKARKAQEMRHAGTKAVCNADLTVKDLPLYCQLGKDEKTLLSMASAKLGLSARGINRVIKVARTIADLDGKEEMTTKHLSESLQYRRSDE